MKKALFAMLLLAAASYVNAQTNKPVTLPMPVEAQRPVVVQQPRFGYLDYRAVFESMPGYAEAQKSLAEIKAKYDTETAHNEETFKRMYLEFLQGQKDFPQTIMLKRQKELQEAMENGVKFRNQVADLLNKAQQELEKPLITKLDSAISLVGMERGYDVIINTGERGFPFINKTTGEDVTLLVKEKIATIKP